MWACGPFRLSLGRTLVMGIVNVTPDSFSDGGRHADPGDAVAHGAALAAAGADIVDVGGESTRPGAPAVPLDEELRRVEPVVAALAGEGLCVSVDTRHRRVAEAAIDAGATVVNDVSAGCSDPGMLPLVGARGGGGGLMHMRGEPRTMQQDPTYADVVEDVRGFLGDRAQAAREAGCTHEAVAVDPGIGFGKTLAHNLALLAAVPRLADLGYPVLVGASRKSMFGRLLGLPVGQRVAPSVAVAAWSVLAGASVVRVHDVAETVQAVRVADAVLGVRTTSSRRGSRISRT